VEHASRALRRESGLVILRLIGFVNHPERLILLVVTVVLELVVVKDLIQAAVMLFVAVGVVLIRAPPQHVLPGLLVFSHSAGCIAPVSYSGREGGPVGQFLGGHPGRRLLLPGALLTSDSRLHQWEPGIPDIHEHGLDQ
jgi:hypothetical protein